MEKITKIKKEEIAQIFSYEVIMTVHIVANAEIEAKAQLDEKGGIVTKREVKLLNSNPLFGEIKESEE